MEEYLKALENIVAFDTDKCSYKQFRILKSKQSKLLYECLKRCNEDGGDIAIRRTAYADMSVGELLIIIQKNNEIIEKIENNMSVKLKEKI